MKRLALLLVAVALLWPAAANAQLTMQMSNGWTFSFAGNVNVFWVFTADEEVAGVPGQKNSSVRTGLLPAFATFSAKGKEAGLDLGIHFGFAPQVNNPDNCHDNFPGVVCFPEPSTQAGAQIDMRQVFLTVGLKGGHQILAGRELGLFQRQNILNDMTLFGVGAVGGAQGGGTTLGRIGYGYIYPNFNAQITYSSPAKNQVQVSIGAFQPSIVDGDFFETRIPRLEGEITVRPTLSGKNKLLVWGGGEWQTLKRDPVIDSSATAWGFTGGARLDVQDFSIVGSYYYGKGIGFILGFVPGSFADDQEGRKSDGGYAQLTYKVSKTTLGASWGFNRIRGAGSGTSDGSDALIAQLSSYTGGIYHQWTKSLKLVGEVTREVNNLAGNPDRIVIAGGFMLFY